ncbi:MAG: HNH endonuclease domain-containing protein [Candidatus Omnitrophica bacterium]|nr:HNH endonuclease domain-containing protein [Candidatus Omnitrophota bacterium]
MPASTPSYVKNIIRRSLREIVDPSPSKEAERTIWEYFNSECAYCGKKLRKEHREGHIDHLVPDDTNQLCNRVLSCADCNGDEKRDKPWKEFLAQKCSSEQIEAERKSKILQWQSTHEAPVLGKGVLSKIESLANDVAARYDEILEQARRLRNKK